MASIPWFVHAGIGGVIAIASYLISATDLVIFMYAGIIMFLWGILKLLFQLKNNSGTAKEHIMAGSHSIRCDDCRVNMHALFNYCPKCGKRHR